MKKKLSYEQSVSRLEEIVELLENGELPLEESMKLFEEGTKLSAECYSMLSKAEQKITQISDIENETINEEEQL
ncbi:MAG: exodeoxyribonuclease VII small subunit [Clostridia bacterium]|nr:exodeoxyribonuclease VII small subunit [Clostridia bacterium]